MFCSGCGVSITSGVRFCANCGAGVAGTGSVPVGLDQAGQSNTPQTGGVPTRLSNTADALIGRTIEGKYHLDGIIGAGGMGTVYQATRLMIGDTVAIKIMHSEFVKDDEAERFRREAQAAARLKHPNAVQIYDFGVSTDGLLYLVMELVEGESLRAIIRNQGPLTPSAAAEVMRQACAALDEAHAAHIVHRDVKPDNIVVRTTAQGLRVKVLDFGIAKLRDMAATNLTQTGSVMGTPHYMSPEQCMGEEIDSRSDVYSLGVVLYEMLAGVVPFNSPTSTAVVVQHVTQQPPPIRQINVSLTAAVESVVLHALAKRREERPQTAGALAQELTAAVSGTPIEPAAHAQALNVVNPIVLAPLAHALTPAPTTAPQHSHPTPASGSMPTMVMQKPEWTSGAGAPAPDSATHAGASPAAAARKQMRLVAAVGAALLLLLVVGGAGAWLLRAKHEPPAAEQKTPTPPAGMAYIPGGDFTMGNDAGDDYERPAHKVTVRPFFIALYEVTCADYEKFIKAKGYPAPPDWINGEYPAGSARHPITGVTWDDANAYAAWAGRRLPTEAEWEFAARGTDGRRYPWGNDWRAGMANADVSSVGGLADVGQFKGASPFGLYDVVGNAWEWTASKVEAYPNGQLSGQPLDDLRIIRGGAYESRRDDSATTTYRRGWAVHGAATYAETGFRCAKDAPQK